MTKISAKRYRESHLLHRGSVLRNILYIEILSLFVLFVLYSNKAMKSLTVGIFDTKKDYIKWVDCKVTNEALECAYEYDKDTYQTQQHLDWIDLIAYTAAKNGGEFPKSSIKDMREAAEKIKNKETTMKKLTKKLKYYPYFKEVYQAILSDYVGTYKDTETGENTYGLIAFSPIAKGFEYNDYDDFGVSRNYGYKREHLGHDMMGRIGTPVICVIPGYVEALGWNQYGGWRIGIRSFDKKKYYYYAHLRQNYPYAEGLKEGDVVHAGQVIGYMGHTGYSRTENVNNIETVHLHFGMQLIFDESQKDGNTEIWINPYEIIQFLSKHRASVKKVGDTREWKSLSTLVELQNNGK